MNFKVYKAADGYRWRSLRDGRIVADSGDAYRDRRDAVRALRAFIADVVQFCLKPIARGSV